MESRQEEGGLLLVPKEKSDAVFRAAFWQWVELLANGEMDGAVEALLWPESQRFTGAELQDRIGRFFNDEQVMVPIIPNERLVELINSKMEIEWSEEGDDEQEGWARALIPVSPEPQNAKNDDVSLMGISVSFFIVSQGGANALEFEVFHV